MTSRNSFFNLLKEDLHRRLWTLILSSLVFFGTFMVAFTMLIQNYVERYSRSSYGYTEAEIIERISRNLCQDFYGCYPWFILVAVVGAVICGMNGFAYLHSRKQMDFYHSLPVKREKIFAVRLVNGILIYALPYFIGLLYAYLLCILFRVMTWDIFFCGMFFFVVHLMGYIIMYLATILAMMLTGKMVIAFFGTCVINLYAPAIYGLFMVLKDTFFVTSYSSSVDMEEALLITRWISPTSYYFSLITAIEEDQGRFWLEFLSFLLLAAVLVGLNLWLYKKRASEKADIAMSFKESEPVIRVMISLPVGILAGLLFYSIQYDYRQGYSVFWLIFGGLLGGFLCHGIIEALYNSDIKKCLSHKIQMIATMIVAAVIPLVFLYDVFGYDSYLPKKKDIASMAVISNEMRFNGAYYDENGWVSPVNYALEHMEATNIDAMYELAELLAEDAGENRAERFFGYNYTAAADIYYAGGAEKVNFTEFVIRYNLKDGSAVTRCYEYNYYAVLDLLERIYNDREFRTSIHPVFSLLENTEEVLYAECYSPAAGVSVKLEKNLDSILSIYAEDVLELSFDELKNSSAIGELTIHFIVKNSDDSEYEDSTQFLVYPSMTRTLTWLREQGYQMRGVQEADNIESITVYYGGTINDLKRTFGMEVSEEEEEAFLIRDDKDAEILYEKYGELVYPVPVEAYQDISVTFTDPAEIAEIKKNLVSRDYVSEFGPFPESIGFLNTEVYFTVDTGVAYESGLIGWNERFRFKTDSVPQFVLDRILKELGAEQ